MTSKRYSPPHYRNERVICISLQALCWRPFSALNIHRVLWVFHGNTCEMLPQFIEKPLASAEVWQLPVEVASDITEGGCVEGGVGWLGPLRAPGGKTVSAAATVQLQYMHSSVRGAVWELANCLRVDLRALTAGQPNVCIRLHFSPRGRVTTDQVLVAIWGPSNICIRPQIPAFFHLSRYSKTDITLCWHSRGGTLPQQHGEKINTERTFSLLPVRSHVAQFSCFCLSYLPLHSSQNPRMDFQD